MHEVVLGFVPGLVLGARHALEPDHLAAMSTLLAEPVVGRRWLLGVSWGLGHTLSLLLLGASLAAVRAQLPAWLGDTFEFGVALMLIGLGARALLQAARVPVHSHTGEAADEHAGHAGGWHRGPVASVAHLHLGPLTLAVRPLLVGMMHGLAGSGALTALALSRLSGTAGVVGFLAVFGLGSVVGMGVLTGLLGWPLSHLLHRPQAARGLFAAAGALSAGVGVWWGAPLLWRWVL